MNETVHLVWRSFAADWYRVARWWVVGMASVAMGLPLLYLTHDVFDMTIPVATAVSGELGVVLRFLANDRIVFGHVWPHWRRLWRFHVASASGFLIWWIATYFFTALGLYYLLAAFLAIGCSVTWNLASNFVWVWRRL